MQKLCALLLFIIFMFTLSPVTFAQTSETIIIAGSDFQHPEGNAVGTKVMYDILSAIKNDGVDTTDGFFFCGDYDYDSFGDEASVKAGVQAVKDVVTETVSAENLILAQGNHDTAAGTCGMTTGGANDPEHKKYGVFVINNDEYMWKNTDKNKITETSHSLQGYLKQKLSENYKQPVFIVSHLPLHYSMRTANDGDGMYAKLLFDVINSAARKGLNIVFLYGHDHSNGWDDYLGGASVFLKKGDSILIAQNSKTEYKSETLAFTYMNAGFVSYYNDHNGADSTLTMTVFRIKGNELSISRFSANGLHLLKSKGITNTYKNETGYLPDLTEYQSPQNILLYENIINQDGEQSKFIDYAIPIGITAVSILTAFIILSVIIKKKKE